MKKFFSNVWRGIQFVQNLIVTLIFFFLVYVFISLINTGGLPIVPEGAALVIAPEGDIVEQRTARDSLAALTGDFNNIPPETLLRDVVGAIRAAAQDKRITVLVLSLDDMRGAGPSKLQYIGTALREFKESGKKIIAYGDSYSQQQYYLAAHADEVYLHPYGSVILTGYGSYPTYYAGALEKIKASVNVFRVGAFKSAVEPYLRDDMSDEAKEANRVLLNDLWGGYLQDVATVRALDAAILENDIGNMPGRLRNAGGDFARLALESKLVDDIKTRDEVRALLIEQVGATDDGASFKSIGMGTYLTATQAAQKKSANRIGVVIARGEILDGEQPAGRIGGDTVARLIRQARENDAVKAVVLRVDSGGGSQFASEIIRRELELTQQAGKPVIASMGSVAASGGYWISASADEIWAAPTTITGSIGIFGILMTFENSLDMIGVHADGVGTTPLSGQGDIRLPLSPFARDIFQQSTENGYRQFINLVAEHRGMTPAEVDKVGQGRVWSGARAKEFGLVDELGYLDHALDAAARRAGLDDYSVIYIEPERTFEERVIDFFFGAAVKSDDIEPKRGPSQSDLLLNYARELMRPLELNDPRGLYTICLECEVR